MDIRLRRKRLRNIREEKLRAYMYVLADWLTDGLIALGRNVMKSKRWLVKKWHKIAYRSDQIRMF